MRVHLLRRWHYITPCGRPFTDAILFTRQPVKVTCGTCLRLMLAAMTEGERWQMALAADSSPKVRP